MSVLREIFVSQLSEAMGWTILHSVWQAGIIGLVALVLIKARQNSNANYRYGVNILSMFSILLSSAVTFLIIYRSSADVYTSVAEKMRIEGPALIRLSNASSGQEGLDLWLHLILPWLSTIWSAGVIFFSVRFAGGLLLLQRYRNHMVSDLPDFMAEKIYGFIDHSGITRTIRVRVSEMVRVPMVIGIIKPVILVPAGIISLLPLEQLEAVIAHELAHIRRYDFLINIVQTLIETLFFYHPAIWLLSSNARAEREKCCDDYAVTACGDLGVYARALANLSGFRLQKPLPAIAFSGKKISLVHRVERLLNSNKMKSNAKERVIAGILILGSAIVLTLSTGAAPVLKIDLNLLDRVKPSEEVESIETAESLEALESVSLVQDAEALEALGAGETLEMNEPAGPARPTGLAESEDEISEIAQFRMQEAITHEIEASKALELSRKQQMLLQMELTRKKDSSRLKEKIDIKDNVVTREFVMKDGTEKSMKYVIRNGEVEELYVDGKKVPKSDHKNYQKEIDTTMDDLVDLEKDLKKAQQVLEKIDFDEIQADMKEELDRFREQDLPQLQEDMKKMQLDMQLDQEKLQQELKTSMEDIQIDKEAIQKEIERAQKEMQEHFENYESGEYPLSKEEIRQMEHEIQQALKEIEQINQEEIMASVEKEMKAIQEIDFAQMQKEIEQSLQGIDLQKIESEISAAMKDIELQKVTIEEEKKHIDVMVMELEKLELKK